LRFFWPVLLLAISATAGTAPSRADEVLLTNGARLQGKVLNPMCRKCGGRGRVKCEACRGTGQLRIRLERRACPACRGKGQVACAACGGLGVSGKKIRLRLGSGVLTELARNEVRAITWKQVDPDDLVPVRVNYRKKLARLDPGSAKQNFELGNWCQKNKLLAEARKHFEAAAKLDPGKYRARVAPYLREMDRKRERAAVKALLAALAVFERKGPAEGGAAIRAVRQDYPESEIVRRAELQRDLIRAHFPKLAAAGCDTIEKLLSKVKDRAAAQCPTCRGAGRVACPDCGGTGSGKCAACGGTGGRACPVCRGARRLTCPKCYGRGKLQGGTLGYGRRLCPGCGGRGEVTCDFCGGKGRVRCRFCGGTGKVPKACERCRGGGLVSCPDCLGSGVRRVTKFEWGPPPIRQAGVINVAGPGARLRAWQGACSGGTITVVPAKAIWQGALVKNVSEALGRKIVLMAVALDNRKGTRLLRFRPPKGTVRAVTADAGQVKMLDLPGQLAASKAPRSKTMLKSASQADCLPGAYVCALIAFPEGTEADKLANLFWVQSGGEPTRLSPIWLSAEEVSELRKSLK